MDYEKKYKEALERFKTFREKYCTYGDLHFGDVIFDKTGEAQKDLDAIFPELAESEDERMIKAIEHILYENYSDAAVIEGVEIAEIVTWLEKQKEPIDPFDTKLFQDGVKEGRRLEREDIKKGPELTEELKKWKKDFDRLRKEHYGRKSSVWESPIMTHEMIMEKQEEQKPAEWSAEDENNLELVIDCIYKFYPDPVMKYKLKEWLKSLRPVKQEWSDEDEKMRRNLMSLLSNMRGDRITEETYKKYYPWLKDLRPTKDCSDCAKHLEGYISGRSDAENKLLEQFGALITPEDELHIKPRWKPSEEQMNALQCAIAFMEIRKASDYDISPLKELHEQLQKL